jgi:NodT family efflux transporter outer membrane factor (OMF) lipoprotein
LHRLVRRVVLCLAAAALTACALRPLPERAAALALPEQWSSGPGDADAASVAGWWERFEDPLLAELVTRALERNTDIRVAQARLAQARAARELALAGLRPALSASALSQRNGATNTQSSSLVQGSLEAGWDLDLFGSGRRGAEAARSDLEASDATLATTRTAIAAEVAIGYVQLRGTQARLAIARDTLTAQRQTLEITQWRAQAGLTSSLDVEQSRAAVAQTESQLPALEAAIAQGGHALSVLTAENPRTLHARLAEGGTIPEPPPRLTLGIPGQTLRQRPDVRAAELAADAAAARVAQTGATSLPSFLLRSSVAWSAISLGSLGGTAARALVGSTTLPIFDGGTRRAQLHSQQAQFEAAQAAYDASVLGALQEVEDLLAGISASRERLAALRRAAEAAGNAALLANHRYAGGLADFQTVLETQRSLLSAQDGVAATQADLAAGHVRLYKALGGGWTSAAAPPGSSQENRS